MAHTEQFGNVRLPEPGWLARHNIAPPDRTGKLAALAAAAGSDWFYRFPVRKKDGGQDYIEGPSIKRCAQTGRNVSFRQLRTFAANA